MQHLDYYGVPDSYRPDGTVLSADDVARLAQLMRELMDLTQSRRTHADAAELLSRLTGAPLSSTVVRPDVLAQ